MDHNDRYYFMKELTTRLPKGFSGEYRTGRFGNQNKAEKFKAVIPRNESYVYTEQNKINVRKAAVVRATRQLLPERRSSPAVQRKDTTIITKKFQKNWVRYCKRNRHICRSND